jgi:hypothetical protein
MIDVNYLKSLVHDALENYRLYWKGYDVNWIYEIKEAQTVEMPYTVNHVRIYVGIDRAAMLIFAADDIDSVHVWERTVREIMNYGIVSIYKISVEIERKGMGNPAMPKYNYPLTPEELTKSE